MDVGEEGAEARDLGFFVGAEWLGWVGLVVLRREWLSLRRGVFFKRKERGIWAMLLTGNRGAGAGLSSSRSGSHVKSTPLIFFVPLRAFRPLAFLAAAIWRQ